MTNMQFDFEGLDRAEEVLAQAAAGELDPQYLRILRVESASSQPSVARKNWSMVDLSPYLHEDEADGADMRGVFDDPLDVDDGESGQTVAPGRREEHAALLAAAACRWVRDMVRGQMGRGDDEVVFALELRGPKGERKLAAPRFRCRRVKSAGSGLSTDGELAKHLEPTIPLDLGVPTRSDIARSGAVADPDSRSWNVLSEAWGAMITGQARALAVLQSGYAHQSRVVLASLQDVRGTSGILVRDMGQQITRLHRECSQKDELIRKLADELIGFRVDLASLGIQAHGAEVSQEVQAQRLKVAESFVKSLGDLGQLYVAGKLDIEPELVDLLMLVRKRPRLLQCLRNKKVQQALENDELVAGIIETLEAIAASIPDEDAPPPTDPPTPGAP